MADHPSSAVTGNTPAERRIIAGAVAGNGAPTSTTPQMANVLMFTNYDIVAQATVNSYDFLVWWFYKDAGIYILDTSLGVAGVNSVTVAGGGRAVTAPSAASGVYVQVQNFAAGGIADVWAIGRGSRRP